MQPKRNNWHRENFPQEEKQCLQRLLLVFVWKYPQHKGGKITLKMSHLEIISLSFCRKFCPLQLTNNSNSYSWGDFLIAEWNLQWMAPTFSAIPTVCCEPLPFFNLHNALKIRPSLNCNFLLTRILFSVPVFEIVLIGQSYLPDLKRASSVH